MKLRLTFLIALFSAIVAAQTAVPNRGSAWYTPMAYVPNSATDVVAATVFLDTGYLANTSGSAVTCTFIDKTTACGSSACQIWPAVSIAANSTYVVPFNGIIVAAGVRWSCSQASAIVGQMRGSYTR